MQHGETSKLVTNCGEVMKKSLKCMETGNKEKCADFIEEYKKCRKAEQQKILDERAKNKTFF